MSPIYPLITHDPVGGGELLVTRLESPHSGVVLEGRFSLGWIGRLTPEQLEFVGALLRNRANVQKLASEVGIAYNTARGRLDEIVAALGGPPERATADTEERPARAEALQRLAAGEIDFDDALRLLTDTQRSPGAVG